MIRKLKSQGEILRQKTEVILEKLPSLIGPPITVEETLKLVHELEVHQIELQMMLEMMTDSHFFEKTEKENREVELIAANVELKIKNEELQKSKRQYQSMIESSLYAIVIISEGIITFANPSANILFGAKSGQSLIGMKMMERIHPDFHQLVYNRIAEFIDNDTIAPKSEMKYLKLDGTIIDVEIQSNPISYGGVLSIQTAIHDITEQKLNQEKIRISEQRLQMVMDVIQEGIFDLDVSSGKGLHNTQWYKLLGMESGEIDNTFEAFINIIHPDDKAMVLEKIDAMFQGKTDQYNAELRLIGNRKTIWVQDRGNVVERDAQGHPLRIIGSMSDITERKQTEEKLKQSSARLELATRSSGIGIWEYDLLNHSLLWDDQTLFLYGIEKNEFVADYQTWLSKIHPDDAEHAVQAVQMAIRGEKELDCELRVVWPDGSVRTLKTLAGVQHDQSGNPIRMVGTNWDITEQKNAESALSKARNEAEAANKSKSIFLANMSHEIRTPLNAIFGFSQLLNREHLTDTQKEFADSIHRSGEHLLKLLNDILELSKIEAGYAILNQKNVNLHSLFSDVQMIFKELAHAKQLQLIFETEADLPQYILVDDNKLRQILINLIGNSLKFTHEGGIAVRARADRTDKHKTFLVIDVQDSGTGISKAEFGLLFKQFEQTNHGIKQSNGSGLGLALSRELAILMGGSISVASEEGKGSVFTIRVEIKDGKPEVGEAKSTKRVLGVDNLRETFRILVVDDMEENLKMVEVLLNSIGFETIGAVNGEDAISKFEQWNPHLILMDMLMPVMNGYEATRWIKSSEKGKNTPIIALTASLFEDEETRMAELDIQAYIRKPFQENELFDTIAKILGIKYIYEQEKTNSSEFSYLNKHNTLEKDLAKLPKLLVSQMQDAVEVGDFHLLMNLLNKIDSALPDLSRHLMMQAKKYNYDYFQNLLEKMKKK